MNYSPILVPVVALVAWTLVVMLWMAVDAPAGDAARPDIGASYRRGGARQRTSRARSPDEANGSRTITSI